MSKILELQKLPAGSTSIAFDSTSSVGCIVDDGFDSTCSVDCGGTNPVTAL